MCIRDSSKTVYELHGSTLRNYCVKCGAFYDVDFIANSTGVPRCPKCGGIVKPDVVLYEEGQMCIRDRFCAVREQKKTRTLQKRPVLFFAIGYWFTRSGLSGCV